jgi:hypothetical protein
MVCLLCNEVVRGIALAVAAIAFAGLVTPSRSEAIRRGLKRFRERS